MITPGVDGLLVPPQDPAALALAINEMIERGPEARREMGMAGLARARKHSQFAIAQRWEALLGQLGGSSLERLDPDHHGVELDHP